MLLNISIDNCDGLLNNQIWAIGLCWRIFHASIPAMLLRAYTTELVVTIVVLRGDCLYDNRPISLCYGSVFSFLLPLGKYEKIDTCTHDASASLFEPSYMGLFGERDKPEQLITLNYNERYSIWGRLWRLTYRALAPNI